MTNLTNRTVILREVSRIPRIKAKIPYSLRVYEDDVEFLRTLPNASEFIRQAIEGEKRNQRMLGTKNVTFEALHEIAEHYIKHGIELFKEEDYLERLSPNISYPLYHIAELTLACPEPYHSTGKPTIPISELDVLIEELECKEAKAFIQRIRSKIKANYYSYSAFEPPMVDWIINPPFVTEPLDTDELDVVRKIYDEAKMLLEKAYRKAFHKSLPEDWHMTIRDGIKSSWLRYQLP